METSKGIAAKIKNVEMALEQLAAALGVLPNFPELGREALLQNNPNLNDKVQRLYVSLGQKYSSDIATNEALVEDISKALISIRESYKGGAG